MAFAAAMYQALIKISIPLPCSVQCATKLNLFIMSSEPRMINNICLTEFLNSLVFIKRIFIL